MQHHRFKHQFAKNHEIAKKRIQYIVSLLLPFNSSFTIYHKKKPRLSAGTSRKNNLLLFAYF